MTTEKQPPTPCQVCTKAFALKKPDPDGGRRCFAHSTDPVIAVKREALAAVGAAQGAKQKGIPPEMRKPVLAGVVDIDDARAQARAEKERASKAVDAIPLDSKDNVLRFLSRAAGELMDEKPNGWASAAAALARTALSAMGLEEKSEEAEQGEVGAFEFRVVGGKATPSA